MNTINDTPIDDKIKMLNEKHHGKKDLFLLSTFLFLVLTLQVFAQTRPDPVMSPCLEGLIQ